MKQVNIRLDEKLIKEVKQKCLDKEITFQDAVKINLQEWLKK